MTITKDQLKKRIRVAAKQEPADIVIKNGRIVDVFNLEIIEEDIAICDGVIVAIGTNYDGHHVLNAKNQIITPSFIDGHVHIESSMVTPSEFSKVVVPHGVTSIITDPHEIANVSGAEGLQFMLDDAKNTILDIHFMLPSSVPATSFENAGAELNAEDLQPFFHHPNVLGLAEVMDYPAVMNTSDNMIDKLIAAHNATDYIDGHAAGLNSTGVNIYRSAGIGTDHECVTPEEAKDRLRRGMYVMIREGSTAKNLGDLIQVVNPSNSRRCLFCTDDKHLDDLINNGSIDHNVRLAVHLGLDPLMAIQMATLNAAECFGLKTKGAIAPGYDADFLVIEDFESINIHQVYKGGMLVAEDGRVIFGENNKNSTPTSLTNTIHVPDIKVEDLQINLEDKQQAHVIGIIPNQIVTRNLIQSVDAVQGCFIPNIEKDQAKIAVIERHKNLGNIGLGIVNGLSLKGAIASTVAHDSHNLVVAGTNDEDMITAINEIKRINGGLAVVHNGNVLGSLPLEISGLISTKNFQIVNEELQELHKSLHQISSSKSDFNQFLTLAFLSLPVIPELKLTDLGLFDVKQFKHIEIAAQIEKTPLS
ncbi:adenine deaminase [Evansella tamaricis]|uniref:Adenine deaminase n=1 Tax=Evansella tamaricis TaxID=2069301 RepID=A0ABS6JI39_9BACI|nr:adenine deaminase [Evansella tamaricis]MBU9712130.1 adenine deaminase [Evansella tamaricis]